MKSADLKVGTRVRFDEYTHPISNYGLTVDGKWGTVTSNDGDYLYVHMDNHFEDLDEWDNDLQWSLCDGDEFPFDRAAIVRPPTAREIRKMKGGVVAAMLFDIHKAVNDAHCTECDGNGYHTDDCPNRPR